MQKSEKMQFAKYMQKKLKILGSTAIEYLQFCKLTFTLNTGLEN